MVLHVIISLSLFSTGLICCLGKKKNQTFTLINSTSEKSFLFFPMKCSHFFHCVFNHQIINTTLNRKKRYVGKKKRNMIILIWRAEMGTDVQFDNVLVKEKIIEDHQKLIINNWRRLQVCSPCLLCFNHLHPNINPITQMSDLTLSS